MNAGSVETRASAGRGRWDAVSVRPVWDWPASSGAGGASHAGDEHYCVQTPGTPLMAIQRKGARIEIGWEGGEEFMLEVAREFTAEAAWKPVTQRPRRWANLNLVVMEPRGGERFFRLRRCCG